MVRVLLRGMVQQGLTPPPVQEPLTQATIGLDLKRAVIASAIAQGGLACLPRLGRGLHDLAQEPTHLALTAGQGAAAMLVRWQRLERYIHSRHRIRIVSLDAQQAELTHLNPRSGPPPMAVEDLVVCGVLCALLEAKGLTQVRAESAGVELFPHPDPAQLAAWVQRGQTHQWTLHWHWLATGPVPHDHAASWAQHTPKDWSPLAASLGDLVAHRLPDLLPMDEAAEALGLSRRSLQRALAREGLGFVGVQGEVRFRLAGSLLLQQAMPVSEVGFVCGYADQAHLTREFKKRLGVTPAKYRELFAPA